ncbi:putative ribonuclease H-like domain-containing protein [Tanacetum coccineum]
MHEKCQMSSMGELTFFLGSQVKQKKDGIFISQDKYVDKILEKFGFTEVKTTRTPMETQKPLLKDKDGEEVDVHMYRKGLKRQKEAKTVKNRQGTKETRKRVNNQPKIKAGSAQYSKGSKKGSQRIRKKEQGLKVTSFQSSKAI